VPACPSTGRQAAEPERQLERSQCTARRQAMLPVFIDVF
jgi:hypothetical protein